MDNRRILQVVPRLGSVMDGVADYARVLGEALRSEACCEVSYLVGDPGEPAPVDEDTPSAGRLHARAGSELASTLEAIGSREGSDYGPVVLLHYVGYGYARRGCPFWLADGLEQWKQRNAGTRLVTVFHELYATGLPWQSSFWLSPLQRLLARRLCGLSDAVVTNREQSRAWLLAGPHLPRQGIVVLPVFSCIGEPGAQTAGGLRRPQMVVLGRSGEAHRAYGRCRDQLALACRQLGIEEILDIGARSSPVPPLIGEVPVRPLGHLGPHSVREILATARAGFVDYPSDYLGKSTVFAAYAAFGMIPVVSLLRGLDEPGLAEGRNYWVPSPGGLPPADVDSVAREAMAWYSGHRLGVQARRITALCDGSAYADLA